MGKVLVIGDVTLDWLEEAIPRFEPEEPADLRNFQLYPGFNWTPIWGGAALLQRLVDSALTAQRARAGSNTGAQFEVVEIPLPKIGSPETRPYLQSLALVKRVIEEHERPLRVEQFKGFTIDEGVIGSNAGTNKATTNTKVAVVPVPKEVGRLDCLILDDAANGCRWNDDFLRNLKALAKNTPLVIVKLSRPLGSSRLVNALPNSTSDRRVVIIVNADDLRAQGVDISRRLSWERTALDVVSASRKSPLLHEMTQRGDVAVRLGSDGCVVLLDKRRKHLKGRKHLVFDPHGTEDAFDHKLVGTMPGTTSAFVARVTAALLTDHTPDALLNSIRPALSASRNLLKQGFVANDKTLDYPLDVFGDDYVDDFSSVRLPDNNAPDDWSVLAERLKNDDPDLPKNIVRDGPDLPLARVPTARYKNLRLVDRREIEGYRSIENLLREYRDSMRGDKLRPLSVGVFGPPGSGKSFGITQIAEDVGGKQIETNTFNLTQLEGPNDLVGAFHIARDGALRGLLPLLIFDEFDCAYEGEPWGWLKYFLAPMQDGSFKDGGFLHPLGPAIFVFAGGMADNFAMFSNPVDNDLKAKFKTAKGPDFVSRLKGYVDVQGINPAKDGERDVVCETRRAILLHALLSGQKHRTQNLFPVVGRNPRLEIDDAVLDALLGVKKYLHGARSLEAILGMSRIAGKGSFGVASLPSDTQLSLHGDQSFIDTINAWSWDR
jgi:hypothetical protein